MDTARGEDLNLPDGDGIQATEQIKMLTPTVNIIMLTARDDDQSLARPSGVDQKFRFRPFTWRRGGPIN